MKVKVMYPVVRTMEIEIPDELANAYEKAEREDDEDAMDEESDKIYDYLQDTIPQIDADADYKPDIHDWEIV